MPTPPIAVISTLSFPSRWSSVFVRWQLRRAFFLAIAVRIILSAVLLYPNDQLSALPFMGGDRGTSGSILTGIGVALYAVALTMTVCAVDAARFGAPDLMANLGYSRGRLVALSAVPPALLEIVINAAADVA